jgi:hypothetical protein
MTPYIAKLIPTLAQKVTEDYPPSFIFNEEANNILQERIQEEYEIEDRTERIILSLNVLDLIGDRMARLN